MTSGVPDTIEQFLEMTGWGKSFPPSSSELQAMRSAFNHFLGVVPRPVLAAPATPEEAGPNPYGFTINGRSTRLCAWMQAIRFDRGVNAQFPVTKSYPLMAFRDSNSKAAGRGFGNWYTFMSQDPEALGLLQGQNKPHLYRAFRSFTCLKSTAADVFATWGVPSGKPAQYSGGGGNQLFIWNAASCLEPAK